MNKKLLLTTSAAIASASIYSFSGVAVAATDTATVQVIQALTITNATTALNFGDIVSTASPETVVGGLRNDPVYNRLTSDVHAAVKQFDAVNKDITHPNVLALVNHDKKCKINDLINVLTGIELTNNGSAFPIFQYYSEGRIRDEKKRKHLFLWVDNWVDSIDSEGFLFCDIKENHYQTLCILFGKDPDSIKQIGS